MEDRLDRRSLPIEETGQRFRGDRLCNVVLGEIAPFVVAAESVTDHQIAGAAIGKRRHQVRSDESGAAGYDDHGIHVG